MTTVPRFGGLPGNPDAGHRALVIRRAALAALRGVLDPEECLRNALPRARACVPHGATPDPLERLVKTVLFLEFWGGWGRKPSFYKRARSASVLSQEASFLLYCRRLCSPKPFFNVFRPFAFRKPRIFTVFWRRKPSKRCLLVSKRHVFYELFESLPGFR